MDKLIIKVVPVPGIPEERSCGIIKFKIITPADVKMARTFYHQNILKEIPLQVIVEKWRKKKTRSQENLFHAIIREISGETGMDLDIVKEGIKQKYGRHMEWQGISFPVPSRNLNTLEYGRLIDGAILEAAEIGLNIRDYKNEWDQWKKNQEIKKNENV